MVVLTAVYSNKANIQINNGMTSFKSNNSYLSWFCLNLRFLGCLTHTLVVFVTLRTYLVTTVAVKICFSLSSRLNCFYMRDRFVHSPFM